MALNIHRETTQTTSRNDIDNVVINPEILQGEREEMGTTNTLEEVAPVEQPVTQETVSTEQPVEEATANATTEPTTSETTTESPASTAEQTTETQEQPEVKDPAVIKAEALARVKELADKHSGAFDRLCGIKPSTTNDNSSNTLTKEEAKKEAARLAAECSGAFDKLCGIAA